MWVVSVVCMMSMSYDTLIHWLDSLITIAEPFLKISSEFKTQILVPGLKTFIPKINYPRTNFTLPPFLHILHHPFSCTDVKEYTVQPFALPTLAHRVTVRREEEGESSRAFITTCNKESDRLCKETLKKQVQQSFKGPLLRKLKSLKGHFRNSDIE